VLFRTHGGLYIRGPNQKPDYNMTKTLMSLMFLLLTAVSVQAKGGDKAEFKEILVKDEQTGEYYYEAVVPVENVAKLDMFKRAKSWVLTSLKTSDNNINADESELSIVNTASVVLDQTKGFGWAITSGNIDFKLNVQFKDGKYKVRFDNVVINAVYVTGGGTSLQTVSYNQYAKQKENKAVRKFKQMVNEKMLAVANSLDAAIRNGSSGSKDW